MLAEIELIGRVSFINEIKDVNESQVVNFGVITEKRYPGTDENGAACIVKEAARWTCSAWGRDAVNFAEYKKVGDVIRVRGELTVKEVDEVVYLNIRAWNVLYLPTPLKREGGVPKTTREVIAK